MKELKAIWAFIVSLNPFAAQEVRTDPIEQIDFVQNTVSVEIQKEESPSDSKGRAEQLALQEAVREVIRRYTPSVPDRRLKIYDKGILADYKTYVQRYETVGEGREKGRHAVRVKSSIRSGALQGRMYEYAIRKPGEHFELEILATPLKGKLTENDDLGGSVFVTEKDWSTTLFGMGARYYFTDSLFFSGSAQWLQEDVEIGTVQKIGGRSFPITLERFTPVTFSLGFKLYQNRDFRVLAGVGPYMLLIRAKDPVNSPASPAPASFSVTALSARLETQWTPLNNLGVGLRADYFQKANFSVLGGKAIDNLLVGAHVITGF